jgi:hypothetical protein
VKFRTRNFRICICWFTAVEIPLLVLFLPTNQRDRVDWTNAFREPRTEVVVAIKQ